MPLLSFDELSAIAQHQMSRWSEWKWAHCARVATLSRDFAAYLKFPASDQESLYQAGLLHDWGQIISMDRSLDWKPQEAISYEDMAQIRSHSQESAIMLQRFYSCPDLVDLVMAHHCRLSHVTRLGVDCGYPREYCQNIQLTPRHWALILPDMYDAMTGKRKYSQPLDKNTALLALRNDAAIGALDGTMVKAFCNWQGSLV